MELSQRAANRKIQNNLNDMDLLIRESGSLLYDYKKIVEENLNNKNKETSHYRDFIISMAINHFGLHLNDNNRLVTEENTTTTICDKFNNVLFGEQDNE